jgi:hypothetical protein
MEGLQIYMQEEGLAAAGRVRQKILAAGRLPPVPLQQQNQWQQQQQQQQRPDKFT